MGLPLAPDGAQTAQVGSAIRGALIWNVATMAFAQIALAGIFLLLAARLDPLTFGTFALAAVVTDLVYMLGASSSKSVTDWSPGFVWFPCPTVAAGSMLSTAASGRTMLRGSGTAAR